MRYDSSSTVHAWLLYVRVSQILRDRHSAFVEGVFGDRLVCVDGTQALKGHDLIVGGVARCILDHIELVGKHTEQGFPGKRSIENAGTN